MNWMECQRKRLWPNYKVFSQHLPGLTEETLSEGIRCTDRDLKRVYPEQTSEA
jgi:hypothetical protein